MQRKRTHERANDSETLNLTIKPLTKDEIKSFANRLRKTPKVENIRNVKTKFSYLKFKYINNKILTYLDKASDL